MLTCLSLGVLGFVVLGFGIGVLGFRAFFVEGPSLSVRYSASRRNLRVQGSGLRSGSFNFGLDRLKGSV